MPVFLKSDQRAVPEHCITVGLVNNMPDEALKATERQYISLLGAASGTIPISLAFYTLPGIPRSEASAAHIAANYSDIDALWQGQIDGLIVTGREPLAARLTDEPYWESFTKTLDWARENAHSTVWSCLAAHAAVLYMDGISRVKLNDKLFGIVRSTRLVDHPLMAGTSLSVEFPHSRWNALPQDHLETAGYRVITRTADSEVDTFVRQQDKLFVFFQGHPEYEADTLLREYRRDIGRYFKGDMAQYPLMPQRYFDTTTMDELRALRLQAIAGQGQDLLPEVALSLDKAKIVNNWHSGATTIYSNWLEYIGAQTNTTVASTGTNNREYAQSTLGQTAAVFHSLQDEPRVTSWRK